jgi:hypothetical protein
MRLAGDGHRRMRTCGRFGAWLALFSLLLQFIATFAHFHPEDFVFSRGGSAGRDVAALVPSPAGGLSGIPAHDDCALCVSLQLVGASAMPEPVRLPPPGDDAPAVPAYRLAAQSIMARHLLFQTRAPPRL